MITKENYYSKAIDAVYMSNSQLQTYCECFHKWDLVYRQDKKKEVYNHNTLTAFLVGNYLHSYLEGEEAHKEFVWDNRLAIYQPATNPELIAVLEASGIAMKKSSKKDALLIALKEAGLPIPQGTMKAEFKKANLMIDAILNQNILGEMQRKAIARERILDFEFEGLKFKGAIDLETEYAIIDYKTTRNFDDVFVKELVYFVCNEAHFKPVRKYLSWMQAKNYYEQLALYQHGLELITGHKKKVFIAAVTKDDHPDTGFFELSQESLDWGLERVRDKVKFMKASQNGHTNKLYCGQCKTCRSMQKGIEKANFIEV